MKHYLSKIHFDPEPTSDDMKLIKIKNGFNVDDERAKLILHTINDGRTLTLETRDFENAYYYGIKFNYKSQEDVEREDRRYKEELDRAVHIGRVLEKGRAWLNTLSDEEREMVEILAYYHFKTGVVG